MFRPAPGARTIFHPLDPQRPPLRRFRPWVNSFLFLLTFSLLFFSAYLYFGTQLEYVLVDQQRQLDIKSSYFKLTSPRHNVAFLGSSFTAAAVIPSVVEAELPPRHHTINLARQAADPYETDDQFKRLFSSNENMTAVVLDLSFQPQVRGRRVASTYDFPGFRRFFEGREGWAEKVSAISDLFSAVLQFRLSWIPQYIWMTLNGFSGWEHFPNRMQHLRANEFTDRPVDPKYTQLIQDQIDIARDQGLLLIYLKLPRAGSRQLDPRILLPAEDERGYYVFDFDRPDLYPELFRPDVFSDNYHLNEIGAEKVSSEIGRMLSDLLSKNPHRLPRPAVAAAVAAAVFSAPPSSGRVYQNAHRISTSCIGSRISCAVAETSGIRCWF